MQSRAIQSHKVQSSVAHADPCKVNTENSLTVKSKELNNGKTNCCSQKLNF